MTMMTSFLPAGGDDDGGSGGDDSDDESFYDYNYMGWADIVAFKTLDFSKAAAKQAVHYEQINDMEVLAKLTNERCSNIVKNI